MANAAKIKSEKKLVETYLVDHDLERTVNEVLNECLRQRPEDPYAQIAQLFKEKSKAGQGVLDVRGRLVYDCAGIEAYEVELITDTGSYTAQVSDVQIPTAAVRLRGSDFVKAVKGQVAKPLIGFDPEDLEAADQLLLALDPTDTKGKVGCNTIYAASVAMCKASAIEEPLFRRIATQMKRTEFAMPVPWVTAIERKHACIGILPTGCNTFAEGLRLTREVVTRLNKLSEIQDPEASFQDLLNAVAACVIENSWSDKIKLAISVKELVVDTPPADEQPQAANASSEDQDSEDTREESKEEKEDTEEGKEADSEKQIENVDDVGSTSFSPPAAVRADVLEAVKSLLHTEEFGLLIAVVENVFAPWRKADMANFVEEHGDHVVLFNHTSEGPPPEGTDEDGEGHAEDEIENGEHLSEGKKSDNDEDEEETSENAEEEGKTGSGSSDSDLSPCNGDRIFVGTPFSDVYTVTDLMQVCETNLSIGQAMTIVWEPGHSTCDPFPADFCVGAGVGLIQLGTFQSPNGVSRMNQLLRIEEELSGTAFYAGSRFRCPF